MLGQSKVASTVWSAAVLFISVLTEIPLEAVEQPQPGESQAIQLVVDYGDGVQKHFRALAWKKGMTVLDATRAAAAHPRGIRIEVRGDGITAFLTKIDDLANDAQGSNWLYRVNGKLATKGCGAQEVATGDVVLWTFTKPR